MALSNKEKQALRQSVRDDLFSSPGGNLSPEDRKRVISELQGGQLSQSSHDAISVAREGAEEDLRDREEGATPPQTFTVGSDPFGPPLIEVPSIGRGFPQPSPEVLAGTATIAPNVAMSFSPLGAASLPIRALLQGTTSVASQEFISPEVRRRLGLPELPPPQLEDRLMAFGEGAVGEGAASMTNKLGRFFSNPFAAKPGGREIARAAAQTGAKNLPLPGMVSKGTGFSRLETAASQTHGGGGIVNEARTRAAKDINSASDDFITSLSPDVKSVIQSGQEVELAIQQSLNELKGLENAAWDQFRSLASQSNVASSIPNFRMKLDDLLDSQRLSAAKNPKVRSIRKDVNQAMQEHGGQIPYERLEKWRKDLNQLLEQSTQKVDVGIPQGELKGLRVALMQDIERSAGRVGGTKQAFDNAKKFTVQKDEVFFDGEIAKLLKLDPEEVIKTITGKGPSQLNRTRRAILGLDESDNVLTGGTIDPKKIERWNLYRRKVFESIFEKATMRDPAGTGVPNLLDGDILDETIRRIGGSDALNVLFKSVPKPGAISGALTKSGRAAKASNREVIVQRKALENIIAISKDFNFTQQVSKRSFSSMSAFGMLMGAGPGATALMQGMSIPAAGATALGAMIGYLAVPAALAKIVTSPTLGRMMADPRARFALGRLGVKASTKTLRLASEFASRFVAQYAIENSGEEGFFRAAADGLRGLPMQLPSMEEKRIFNMAPFEAPGE